jgi:hypothetical protein
MIDPDFQDLERARERNIEAQGVPDTGLMIDGKPHPGCPECGSVEIYDRDYAARERAGSEAPPWRMACENGHEWEEDD